MVKSQEWPTNTKRQRQEALVELVNNHGSIEPFDYMQLVSADQLGIYASMGPNFTYAVFGRDSIEAAEDVLGTHQHLARNVILTMARLQGTKTDTISEEEPGRIHHEYRSTVINGQHIPENSISVMRELQKWWGGDGTDTLLYYGSFDATPLYIRFVGKYIKEYGNAILEETISNKDGQELTVLESVQRATDWLVSKLEASEWGMLEFKRINPNGIPTQAWKDSPTSYLHTDGSTANTDDGLASIELQGYAYDALLAAAELAPERQSDYKSLAAMLQKSTIDHLWMPEVQFFAQGLDRDEFGNRRQIRTLTSNAGLLLESRLLQGMPASETAHYVEAVARKLCGPEFLTDAGIRSRSIDHKDLLPFVDYHGSYTVWPKETYDIAKGLRNFGYHHLADQLENRIIRSVEASGDFYEFFYVEENGEVYYDQEAAIKHFSEKSPGMNIPIPEPGQAWTISAMIAALHHRKHANIPHYISEFEESVLSDMSKRDVILSLGRAAVPPAHKASESIAVDA